MKLYVRRPNEAYFGIPRVSTFESTAFVARLWRRQRREMIQSARPGPHLPPAAIRAKLPPHARRGARQLVPERAFSAPARASTPRRLRSTTARAMCPAPPSDGSTTRRGVPELASFPRRAGQPETGARPGFIPRAWPPANDQRLNAQPCDSRSSRQDENARLARPAATCRHRHGCRSSFNIHLFGMEVQGGRRSAGVAFLQLTVFVRDRMLLIRGLLLWRAGSTPKPERLGHLGHTGRMVADRMDLGLTLRCNGVAASRPAVLKARRHARPSYASDCDLTRGCPQIALKLARGATEAS